MRFFGLLIDSLPCSAKVEIQKRRVLNSRSNLTISYTVFLSAKYGVLSSTLLAKSVLGMKKEIASKTIEKCWTKEGV